MREFLAKMALPLAVSTISTFAVGEDDEQNFVPIGIEDAKTAYQGWDDYLTLGLSGTINESKNVVGKDDGQSTTLGLKVKGGIDYGSGLSQWLNSIDILISYSRSPVIPEYIKAEDSFELDSIYKRYLESVSWLGLFVQGNISTALFDGYDTRAEMVTYRKIGLDDEVEVIEAKRLKLTDSYNPLKIRESLGVIASPYSYKIFNWDIKAGVGFRQVMADGQFVISDDDSTTEIEVQEIQSFDKYGYEFGTEVKGHTSDEKFSYQLKANVLFPVYESIDTEDRSTFDKRVIDISLKSSFHLVEWASLDYLLTVSRDPDINDKAQESQTLLFSLNKVIAKRENGEPES
ncbi:hypothetical protein [Pseudobacteriovorax antillogorgiicola]|uniref:Uncharacterized protein n=1 Tax=Pseudobacteriovorax antillogorgiicola TaxID=1513793 RepID=A0A1Y6BFP1_9BACT|nr:hypothetical protein [Pseudobacteriovorax antillogorgiicola]TCS57436.1 hypothetical protein EDD56_103176 [Pseudobacteriovorax antillogorgiicola]SMF01094.1 hypothetical protein SAMN06296036_103157 [Pseudobacteriovorax antillogorgiicola]